MGTEPPRGRTRSSSAAVHALFLLSGLSGLVYQVVWVRLFGNVFGNTVYSATTVAAVFLCGLGVGGYLAGRWADRRFRLDPRAPLRAYAWFELAIGALGLALALLLPVLGRLGPALAAYVVDARGWHELSAGTHVLRYGVAVVLLVPITFLMGGTLTLLIRYVVARDLESAGWTIGRLYAVNTAGAALGAFLSDFALIPALGIFGTELVAITLNLGVGIAALALASRGGAAASGAPPAQAASLSGGQSSRPVMLTSLAIALAGFTAMGVEIVWFRHAISMVGSYRAVFSLLLTVILVGTFVGALLGGALLRRLGQPAVLYFAAQTLFALAFLGQLAFFDRGAIHADDDALIRRYVDASAAGRFMLDVLYNLRPLVALVGLPSLLLGFTFPLANAAVQRVEEAVGSRAGILYLANTAGNVAGAVVTGFLLLPWLGMQATATVLAACTALSLLSFHRASQGGARTQQRAYLACTLVLGLALLSWTALPRRHLLLASVAIQPDELLVAISEDINETIAIVDRPGTGRLLVTNGHPMSSTTASSQRYMSLLSHLPLLQLPGAKRVLVICYGVGNTTRAATLHDSVERVEVVDLSRHVLEQGEYFRGFNDDVLADEKVEVYVNDGRNHLRMQRPDRYDLITLEPPPLAYAGVSSLYSREFYELARSRLVAGGLMTQWLPVRQLRTQDTLAAIRAFLDVFPNTLLLSGYQDHFILLGAKGDAPTFDLASARAALDRNPALRRQLERISASSLTDLVGSFVSDSVVLERASRGVQPVTDDRPVLEYSHRSLLPREEVPDDIYDATAVARWCRGCMNGGHPVAEVADLAAYLEALHACYQGDAFLGRVSPERPFAGLRVDSDSAVAAAIRRSPYLKALFHSSQPADVVARGQVPCALASSVR